MRESDSFPVFAVPRVFREVLVHQDAMARQARG